MTSKLSDQWRNRQAEPSDSIMSRSILQKLSELQNKIDFIADQQTKGSTAKQVSLMQHTLHQLSSAQQETQIILQSPRLFSPMMNSQLYTESSDDIHGNLRGTPRALKSGSTGQEATYASENDILLQKANKDTVQQILNKSGINEHIQNSYKQMLDKINTLKQTVDKLQNNFSTYGDAVKKELNKILWLVTKQPIDNNDASVTDILRMLQEAVETKLNNQDQMNASSITAQSNYTFNSSNLENDKKLQTILDSIEADDITLKLDLLRTAKQLMDEHNKSKEQQQQLEALQNKQQILQQQQEIKDNLLKQKYEKQEEEMKKLSENYEQLKEQQRQNLASIADLQNQLLESQQQVQSQQKENEEMQDQLVQYEQKMQEIDDSVQLKKDEFQKIQDSLKTLLQDYKIDQFDEKSIYDNLVKVQEQYAKIQTQEKIQQEQIKELNLKLDENIEENKKLKEQLNSQEEIEHKLSVELLQKLEHLKEQYQKQVELNQQLEAQKEEVNSQHQNTAIQEKELQEKISELEDQLNKSHVENNQLIQKAEETQKQLQDTQILLQNAEQHQSDNKNENLQLYEQIKQQQDENQTIQQQIQQLEERNAKLLDELQEVQSELSDKIRQIQQQESLQRQQQSIIEDTKVMSETQIREIEKLKAQLKEFETRHNQELGLRETTSAELQQERIQKDELTDRMKIIEAERDKLRITMSQLEEQIFQYKQDQTRHDLKIKEYAEKDQLITQLKSQVQDLQKSKLDVNDLKEQQAIQEKTMELAKQNLEGQNRNLQQANFSLQAQIDENDKQMKLLKKDLEKSRDDITTLKKQGQEFSKERDLYKSIVQEQEQKLCQQSQNMLHNTSRINELEQKVAAYEENIQKQQHEIKLLNSTVSNYKEQIESSQMTMSQNNQENEQLYKDKQHLEQQKQQLEQQIEVKESQLITAQNTQQELKKQLDNLNSQYNEQTKAINEIVHYLPKSDNPMVQIKNLVLDSSQIQERNVVLCKEITNQQQKLQKYEDEKDEYKRQMLQLQSNYEVLKIRTQQMEEKNKKLNEYEKQIQIINSENEKEKQEKKMTETKINNLQILRDQLTKEKEEYIQIINKVVEELRQLNQSINLNTTNVEDKLSILSSRIDTIQSKNEALRQNIDLILSGSKPKEFYDTIKSALTEQRNKITEQSNKIQQYYQENQQLKQQAIQQEQQYKVLQEQIQQELLKRTYGSGTQSAAEKYIEQSIQNDKEVLIALNKSTPGQYHDPTISQLFERKDNAIEHLEIRLEAEKKKNMELNIQLNQLQRYQEDEKKKYEQQLQQLVQQNELMKSDINLLQEQKSDLQKKNDYLENKNYEHLKVSKFNNSHGYSTMALSGHEATRNSIK